MSMRNFLVRSAACFIPNREKRKAFRRRYRQPDATELLRRRVAVLEDTLKEKKSGNDNRTDLLSRIELLEQEELCRKKRIQQVTAEKAKNSIQDFGKNNRFVLIHEDGREEYNPQIEGLTVILMVGVNGAGKTTTIGKLAHRIVHDEGKKVVVAAGDTFRAGAIDQLAVWAERVGVDIVKGKEGGDPSAVVFDALNKAKETGADVLICDTAGRLQNKVNLMNELEKMNRIIKRVVPEGPHETLLVVDATTGQNGVSQAIEFSKITDITGIVLTKMDGTAKGGIVLSIKDQLNIPVKFIGLGEQVDDLQEFDLEQYIYGLCKGLVEEA